MSERLQDAIYLARRAGELILRLRPKIKVSIKSDGSFVTDADLASQDFILGELTKKYPDYQIMAEEGEQSDTLDPERPTWIVDPLDGTDAFRQGLAYFCVSIGLFEAGRFTLGVVYAPVVGETFSTGDGDGPTLNGAKISTADAQPVSSNSMIAGPSNFHRNFTTEFPGKVRSLGSTAYHMALVARGGAVGGVPWGHLWDVAAGVALVESSGGKIGRLDGSPVPWADYLDGKKLPFDILAASEKQFGEVADTLTPRSK
jgi:myo-inositol-1(or 4)-monophosphatase